MEITSNTMERRLKSNEVMTSVDQALQTIRTRAEIFAGQKEVYTHLYDSVISRKNNNEEADNELGKYETFFKELIEEYSDPVDLAKSITVNLVEQRLNKAKLDLGEVKASKKRLQGKYYRTKQKGATWDELEFAKFHVDRKKIDITIIRAHIKEIEKELTLVRKAARMFKLEPAR